MTSDFGTLIDILTLWHIWVIDSKSDSRMSQASCRSIIVIHYCRSLAKETWIYWIWNILVILFMKKVILYTQPLSPGRYQQWFSSNLTIYWSSLSLLRYDTTSMRRHPLNNDPMDGNFEWEIELTFFLQFLPINMSCIYENIWTPIFLLWVPVKKPWAVNITLTWVW